MTPKSLLPSSHAMNRLHSTATESTFQRTIKPELNEMANRNRINSSISNIPLNGLHGLLSSGYLPSDCGAIASTSGSFGAYLSQCTPHMYPNESPFPALNGFAAGLNAISYAQHVTTANAVKGQMSSRRVCTSADELSCASSCSPTSVSLGYGSGSPGAYSIDSNRSTGSVAASQLQLVQPSSSNRGDGQRKDEVAVEMSKDCEEMDDKSDSSDSSDDLLLSSHSPGSGHSSTKRTRRRVATVAQRRAANIRERRRMYYLNTAFDKLRKRVPTLAYEKRLSRIETLRLAIYYIDFMNEVLAEPFPSKEERHLAPPAPPTAPTSTGNAPTVTSTPVASTSGHHNPMSSTALQSPSHSCPNAIAAHFAQSNGSNLYHLDETQQSICASGPLHQVESKVTFNATNHITTVPNTNCWPTLPPYYPDSGNV
jgi:hypothetical protein